MYCSNCNTEISNDSRLCSKCSVEFKGNGQANNVKQGKNKRMKIITLILTIFVLLGATIFGLYRKGIIFGAPLKGVDRELYNRGTIIVEELDNILSSDNATSEQFEEVDNKIKGFVSSLDTQSKEEDLAFVASVGVLNQKAQAYAVVNALVNGPMKDYYTEEQKSGQKDIIETIKSQYFDARNVVMGKEIEAVKLLANDLKDVSWNSATTKEIDIEVTHVSNIGGNVNIDVKITNTTDESIHISGYDFTLSSSSGYTENLHENHLEGITLQSGQSTSGTLEFATFIEGDCYLNYNGLRGAQQISINIPKWD